ncbi:hypothetical protein [Rubrivirga marina]|uniref:Lipoprotein n=1 Tax=Rubrivirga marina TaxID=1196024 RepID=A0A271J4X6_9BACT|nr:hypothetical protein [Rubrivirga marina]PAP78576.1 hypothetical protein BSZ37_20165 [Rubrivirga marina]
MPARLVLLVALLAGCASSGAPDRAGEPIPTETWTGEMAADALRRLPATLYTGPGRVELAVGSTRVTADEVSYDGERLCFRAPSFPGSRIGTQTLRCDLLNDGRGTLSGSCRAGTDRYRLVVRDRALY